MSDVSVASSPARSAESGVLGDHRVDRPRLLFFYSARDGQSRRVEGFLAQVLQRRRNHDVFRVTRIEMQERPDLVERLKIASPPTLFVVEGDRVKARLERPRGCEQIRAVLEPWLRQ